MKGSIIKVEQETDEHLNLESLKNELNELLNDLTQPYYSFIFRYSVASKASEKTIVVQLNPQKTRLLLVFYDSFINSPVKQEIENDDKILDSDTYNIIRTELQNNRREIKDETITKNAKKQILDYLIRTSKLKEQEDSQAFLAEFSQFFGKLPSMPEAVQSYYDMFTTHNIDARDINEFDSNDPESKQLAEKLGESYDKASKAIESLSKKYGEEYIKQASRDDSSNNEINLFKPDFTKKYPVLNQKLQRVLKILTGLKIEEAPGQLELISKKLGIDCKKLKSYFEAKRSSEEAINKKKIASEKSSMSTSISNYWYSDDDMDMLGRRLKKYGINIEKQFKGRLTQDVITSLPKAQDRIDATGDTIKGLEEGEPLFIAYNIGGKAVSNGGVHWVAIVLVKSQGRVKVLYKDSKGDFNNNAADVNAEFFAHYGAEMEFIRHRETEQKDDSSCGPMTISNLEIMAELIQKEGVHALIDKFMSVQFTKQEEVSRLRAIHEFELEHRERGQDVKHDDAALQYMASPSLVNDSEDNIKSLSEVIEELELLYDSSGTSSITKEEISKAVEKINSSYQKFSSYGTNEVFEWAVKKRKEQLSKSNNDEICEAIALMERTNEIVTKGHRLRDTQKVAIFIFMKANNMAHVSQINTGEGKTTIVSFVQALKVMQGYKGHVMTSNNVLAADGVKSKLPFYKMLGISVAHNNPEKGGCRGARECYAQDIVYGSISNFQFDWLSHSFERLKTMGELNFDNVWVMLDEIDSLLIDQGGNIAKLSGPFPGMESLRYVYINIWIALAEVEEQVTKEMHEELRKKAEELESKESSKEEKDRESEAFYQNLTEEFLNRIKVIVHSQKDRLINKRIIAAHLHAYADASIDRWVEYAFEAKHRYNENVEYKIAQKDGEGFIIPVDNANTGISMHNTVLSNGLHQFLQIKHNLHLTYESLTSCYVSNLNYICKYGNKLSGVTGTLGSESERELLGNVFNIGFSIVPPYKPKNFEELPGQIFEANEFSQGVALTALNKICEGRANLIICLSHRDAYEIKAALEQEIKSHAISATVKMFVDESEATITEEKINVGDIVISTNIGGRGTDFKTSKELEANGGLHVIEAFLPCNKRVQDQGFGRTSRQGNKGKGQIIARLSELYVLGIFDKQHIDFQEIIIQRDKRESQRLDNIREYKILELKFKDLLFEKFSSVYGQKKDRHNNEHDDCEKCYYVLSDLKEKWAFWLERQKYNAERIKELIGNSEVQTIVSREFSKFKEEASAILGGNIKHNPFYSICLADRYIENSRSFSGDIAKENRKKAREELNNALEICGNPEILYAARIKLFEVAIEDGNQILQRYKKAVAEVFFIDVQKDESYKQKALESLEKAKRALEIEYQYLEVVVSERISQIIHNNQEQTESMFVKHLKARHVALGAYLGNIESLKTQMQKATGESGLVIGSKVVRYLSSLGSVEHERKLKDMITSKEVDELEYIGVNSVIQLKEVHDVPTEVITNAQWQIGGGMALLALTTPFPFLLPINGPLASIMISQGTTDIVNELINQEEVGFDKNSFMKAKLISYGISILSMGFDIIVKNTKILAKALEYCRGLATKLREVNGPFAKVCNWLANQLDNISNIIESTIKKVELAKQGKRASDAIMTPKKFFDVVQTATIDTAKSIAISVCKEKIRAYSVNYMLENSKFVIEKKVREIIQQRINTKKDIINKVSLDILEKRALIRFDDGPEMSMIKAIAHNIADKICYTDWRIMLSKSAIQAIVSITEVATYAGRICDKFFEGLQVSTENFNHSEDTINNLVNSITNAASERLYQMIVSGIVNVGKTSFNALALYSEEKSKVIIPSPLSEDEEETDINPAELLLKKVSRDGEELADRLRDIVDIAAQDNTDSTRQQQFKHGDTLWQVAKDNGMSVDEFCSISGNQHLKERLTSDGRAIIHPGEKYFLKDSDVISEKSLRDADPDRKDSTVIRAGAELNIQTTQDASIPKRDIEACQIEVVTLNEVSGNTENAYKLSYAGGNSGPSFGTFQWDIAANEEARKLLIDIISAYEHISQSDKNSVIVRINKKDLKGKPKEIFGERNVYIINQALKSDYAKQKLKEASYKRLDDGNKYIEVFLSEIKHTESYDFFNSVLGRATLLDRWNQHGNLKILLETIQSGQKITDPDEYCSYLKNYPYDKGKNAEKDRKDALRRFDNTQKIVKKHKLGILQKTEQYAAKGASGKQIVDSAQNEIRGIHKSFITYYGAGIDFILPLRLHEARISSVSILPSAFLNAETILTLARKLAMEIAKGYNLVILPLNIEEKHWVGIALNVRSNHLYISYLDSENQKIANNLKYILIHFFSKIGYKVFFQEMQLKQQKYANCGPEVIENFVYLLTKKRVTQEAAPYLHLLLYENAILDPEISALQIAENNRLIAELSNQMRPLYSLVNLYNTNHNYKSNTNTFFKQISLNDGFILNNENTFPVSIDNPTKSLTNGYQEQFSGVPSIKLFGYFSGLLDNAYCLSNGLAHYIGKASYKFSINFLSETDIISQIEMLMTNPQLAIHLNAFHRYWNNLNKILSDLDNIPEFIKKKDILDFSDEELDQLQLLLTNESYQNLITEFKITREQLGNINEFKENILKQAVDNKIQFTLHSFMYSLKGIDVVTDIIKYIIQPTTTNAISLAHDALVLSSYTSSNKYLSLASLMTAFPSVWNELREENYLNAGIKLTHSLSNFVLTGKDMLGFYAIPLYFSLNGVNIFYSLYNEKYYEAALQTGSLVTFSIAPTITGAAYAITYTIQNIYGLYQVHQAVLNETQANFVDLINNTVTAELNKSNMEEFVEQISGNSNLTSNEINKIWNEANQENFENILSAIEDNGLIINNIIRDSSENNEWIVSSSIKYTSFSLYYNVHSVINDDYLVINSLEEYELANSQQYSSQNLHQALLTKFSNSSIIDYNLLIFKSISTGGCKLHGYIIDEYGDLFGYEYVEADDLKICGEYVVMKGEEI